MEGIKDAVYTGTSSYGRFKSIIHLTTTIVIFVVLLTVGVVLLISASKNANDPTKADSNRVKTIIGWICIALAILCLPISIVTFVIIMKVKPVAAATGGLAFVGDLGSAVRMFRR
jgi:heme/copper-type cytochrome/quinol oxidase subunit 2